MALQRDFDIVVLGATGITGRQVTKALSERASLHGLSWAVAGRDSGRLEAMLRELGAEVPVITIDLSQRESIDTLAARTAVIANMVGPYARFGDLVYQACATHGTHQLDLCAEIDWLRDQARSIQKIAESTGAKLVHTAGFESLPTDIASLWAAELTTSRWGEPLQDVDAAISVSGETPILRPDDLISAATLVSGTDAFRRGYHPITLDARFLDPIEHTPLPFDIGARRHSSTGAWLAPMIPSPHINPVIAHRTAALCNTRGRPLFESGYTYREGLVSDELVPGLPSGVAATWMASAQMFSSFLTVVPPAMRDLIADTVEAFGPAPGNAPDPSQLRGWSWHIDLRASTSTGKTIDIEVEGQGHPAYQSSAALAAEVALLLAGPCRTGEGGLLTPASALGTASIKRFSAAGMSIREAS